MNALGVILEMPHFEFNRDNFGLVDFQIEKYHVCPEDKRRLLRAFQTSGFVGWSQVSNKWLYFNGQGEGDLSPATPEQVQSLPHLPEEWEERLLNIN